MTEVISNANNCVNIIRPFVERLAERGPNAPEVQIMGGVGMAAFLHDRLEIDTDSKEVRVPSDFAVDAFRDDGTRRDVDVLVISARGEDVDQAEGLLACTVGDTLERSVFGIRPRSLLDEQVMQPMGLRALRTFLADRYAVLGDDELEEGQNPEYVKSLFPFAVPLDSQLLETWSLVVGKDSRRIPIPHPGTMLANYITRSISGVRPRDYEKLTITAHHVFDRAPDIKDWLVDGPGATQLEFGRIIASIRTPQVRNFPLFDGVTVDTYSHAQLREHEAFMLPELGSAQQRLVLAMAACKAASLYQFEKNPLVVKLWRQYMESRVDAVVKNK